MLPVLQVGPLAVQVPGLVLLAGLWVGLALSERQASRSGISANMLYNLVIIALVSGVVGARLSYVFRYPAAFTASPLGVFSLNPGLLDLWGGLASGVVAGLVYGQRKGLRLLPALDALVPLLAVLAVALGASHLASGSAFGTPAQVPWAIELWGARRHPAQMYEILVALLILGAVWPSQGLLWSRSGDSFPGQRFLAFLALSAGARLFLEAFRGDSLLLPGGIRTAQVIAWLVLAVCLWGMTRLRDRR